MAVEHRGSPSPLEPSAESLRFLTQLCTDFALDHIASLDEQPSWDLDNAAAVADTFEESVPEAGRPLAAILERLRPAVAKSFNTAAPGYLAFIPGGGIPSAALADFLACAVNRYVGVNAAAPALARIESTVVQWLAAMMGYPPGAGGILTSGGSLSNLSAVVTARVAKLPEDFLSGCLYFSADTHLSVAKAARIAGFSERNMRRIAVDDQRRIIPAQLEQAIVADRNRGLRPFLVIANVGSTNTGAVDPLPALAHLTRSYGLWLHADAAYGGFFRIVPEAAPLLRGTELCDSITLDPHKALFLPYGTGALLVRDAEMLRRAHTGDQAPLAGSIAQTHAAYLQDVAPAAGQTNFSDLSLELSRDFRGLRLWLPLQLHGLAAFRAQLAEKLELARWAYEQLRHEPTLELLGAPQLSIVAFRVRAERDDANALGAELLRRVNARRRVFLSSTVIDGRYVLRICVLSFRTHLDRVREAVGAIIEEARALPGRSG